MVENLKASGPANSRRNSMLGLGLKSVLRRPVHRTALLTASRSFSSCRYVVFSKQMLSLQPKLPSFTYSRLASTARSTITLPIASETVSETPFTKAKSLSSSPPPLILSPPPVARWLLLSSTLVFAIVVVGGVTRLTESGLSITEWEPITGVLPPLSQEEWDIEFSKYKATPEFKLTNHSITLAEFKSIFYMEWAHRVLGRVIGITFVAPLAYFTFRKQLTKSLSRSLPVLALLIGAQGALGWYMVKSGLEDSLMDTPGAVPRVSQYRLAAHLGLALALYAGMFHSGMSVIKDWKFANGGAWSGLKLSELEPVFRNKHFRRFRTQAWALSALVFLTAVSGAFVAGLDAGLVYNEFPYMGENLVPPSGELFNHSYAKKADGSDLWWRNILENPTTVQFDHRLLAVTTYCSTGLFFLSSRSSAMKAALPPLARTAAAAAFGMANIQVLLGISTLLYLVPTPLAAAHQAGSVALLSAMIHLLVVLRRPGLAARIMRAQRTKT